MSDHFFLVDLHDIQQYTALHCASETGDPNILLTLIDNGADVNARGPLGRTPLHVTVCIILHIVIPFNKRCCMV